MGFLFMEMGNRYLAETCLGGPQMWLRREWFLDELGKMKER